MRKWLEKMGLLRHKHRFRLMPWDRQRLGPSCLDPDPDPGTKIAFVFATFKSLYRCECGKEIITSERSLM